MLEPNQTTTDRQEQPATDSVQPRLLKVEEASRYLGGLHPDTVYEMGRLGEIPVVKLKRAVLFDVRELDRWIDKKLAESKNENLSS